MRIVRLVTTLVVALTIAAGLNTFGLNARSSRSADVLDNRQ